MTALALRADARLRHAAANLASGGQFSPEEAVRLALEHMRGAGEHPSEFGIELAKIEATSAERAARQADREKRRVLGDRYWETPEPEADTEEDRRLTPAEARAECDAAIARSRETAGMPPLPVLRWVDYTRGATYSPPSWLVKNVLPGRGLGLIYGESSAGKTFLAVHASLCVAWGVPFFGRRAKPGGVLYIAAEGGSGVLPRFDAAEHVLEGAIAAAHLTGSRDPAVARAPIRIVTEAPNLSREGDTAPLIRTIRATAVDFERLGFPLAVVIVDTLHAALGGGDENSAADMGHALKPLKDAVEEMNLFALIVHHPGKALERGARGSGSLPAAVDTSIELHVPGCTGPGAKPAGMMRCATVVKQRDGAVGESLHYRLPVTTIGVDEDGEPWTTCTVQPCDPPKLDDDGLSKTDRNLIDAVRATLAEERGERARFEVARLRFFNLLGEKTAAAKRQAWGRALKIARDAGRIETDDHDLQIWIPKPAGEV